MSIDLGLIKLFVPAVIALLTLIFALPKTLTAWEERRHFHRAHRRTESDFAIQLSEILGDSNIKRYGEELGYAALVGDRHLSHAQRKLLLTLPDAQQLVETYMRTRDLLDVSCEKQGLVLRKPRFQRKGYRFSLRLFWFLAYLLAVLVAFSPWLSWGIIYPHTPMSSAAILVQVVTIISFLPFAIHFLNVAVRISEAERLMAARAPATPSASPRSPATPTSTSPP